MPGLYRKSSETMTELADNSIDLSVTSPPNWALAKATNPEGNQRKLMLTQQNMGTAKAA